MLLPQPIKKIGIFRALQLGDMLNVIPAIRSLRSAYPTADIVLIGLPWATSFAKRFHHYFNRFIPFPGYPGLPEQPFNEAAYQSFLQTIYAENFDLLLQMQGNGTIVNEMLSQWNVKHLAGFCNEESFVASRLFMQYPNFGSEIHRHLLLMQHLSLPLQGDHLEFPTTGQDEQEWHQLRVDFDLEHYVCIHPGSRGAWRQWPPEYFAKLADSCAEYGLMPVVTGTNDEVEITKNVIRHMTYKSIDLTGKTSLGCMALLIKNAYCLIANCTGVSHLASAFKTPSIIISMDGEPERWSPLDASVHRVTDWTKTPDFSIPYGQLISFLSSLKSEKKQFSDVFFCLPIVGVVIDIFLKNTAMLLTDLQTESYFNGFDYGTAPDFAPTITAYDEDDDLVDDDDDIDEEDDDLDEADDADDVVIADEAEPDEADFDDADVVTEDVDDLDEDDLDEDEEDDDDDLI